MFVSVEKNVYCLSGALYPDGTSGRFKKDDAVAPGENYTYTWKVTEEFAPTNSDSNCLTWIYHSHVDAPRDIATGLIGVLLTCNKGTLRATLPQIYTCHTTQTYCFNMLYSSQESWTPLEFSALM